MSSVKKLNIRPKARNLKMKLCAIGLGTILLVSSIAVPIAIQAHKEEVNNQRIEFIVEYYGRSSEEKTILDYIEVSDLLHELDLSKYTFDNDLFQKYAISSELKTPEEIKSLITQFETVSKNIDSKNLNQQSKNIELILILKSQEKLVNSYIYDTGYFIAYSNIRQATKEYAAETFGLDAKNVEFGYVPDSNDGAGYSIKNNLDKYDKEVYNFDSLLPKMQEKNITQGISNMVETDVSYDKNLNDNDQYNKERNDNIKDALYNSAFLNKENNENNLYNEKLAGKFK